MLPFFIIVMLAIVLMYNSLIKLNVRAESAWADIDVQLKRRHDLIPNLVETVKGYAAHERGTFEAVVTARNRAMQAESPAQRAEAEASLTTALQSLFALAEAYPELRATENYGQLSRSLSEIEDAIQNARRYYNAVVRDLNTRAQQFPTWLVARAMNLQEREFFSIADGERSVPEVSL